MSEIARVKPKQLVYAAFCGAVSYVLMAVTSFPIFAGAPFLKVELSEIPLLLLSVLLSPSLGFLALLTKDFLYLLLAGGNIFGIFADILASGCFIGVFAVLVRSRGTTAGVTLAAITAVLVRLAVVIPVNLAVLYLEFGTPPAGVMAMMPYILPFNAIKSALGIGGFVFLQRRLGKLGMEMMIK